MRKVLLLPTALSGAALLAGLVLGVRSQFGHQRLFLQNFGLLGGRLPLSNTQEADQSLPGFWKVLIGLGRAHLQPGQDAGLLGVGGEAPGAGDTAETLGFTVESVPDPDHPAHLTGG